MSKFWVVAGAGHCGTKWLAEVFNSRPDAIGLYRYKQAITQMSWPASARYENRYGLNNAKYKPYFEAIKNAQVDIVVDANSWSPALLPDVNDIVPIDRVIYVVRNGVSQLHSMRQSTPWEQSRATSFIYNRYLRPYFDLTGYMGRELSGVDKWERLCLYWNGIARIPEILRQVGLPVEVVKFEDLTQGEGLRIIVGTMDNEDLVHWRGKNVNRSVMGDRRPETLWASWSNYQRNVFEDVCGTEMEHLGYQMPGV